MGRKKLNKKEKGKSKEKKTEVVEFNKYKLYEATVQAVENDIEFINEEFKRLRNREPLTIREDFGGTGMLCCEWAKQSKKHVATAVDLDPEPIDYGKKNHYSKLNENEQKRVKYLEKNVLEVSDVKAEVIVAFNFSYFIFKQRKVLLNYFKEVHKALEKDGVFFMDIFGGTESQTVLEEQTEYKKYNYFWDCDKWNPITHECLFKIHFKPKGAKKIKDVFIYDWRMWTLPELMDLLEEAGFSKVETYWEEDDDDGGGNGEFYPTREAENCESWVTYIAALK